MFSLYSNSKGSGVAVLVRRLVQPFDGQICYSTIISWAGSWQWPLASVRLLCRLKKRINFRLFVTSLTVHIGRWRKFSTFELNHDKTNTITVYLAVSTQISLGILSVWSVFATVDPKIPIEYMKRNLSINYPDAHADLSLRRAHCYSVGFAMWLISSMYLSYPLRARAWSGWSDAQVDATVYVRHFLGFVRLWFVLSKTKGPALSAVAKN